MRCLMAELTSKCLALLSQTAHRLTTQWDTAIGERPTGLSSVVLGVLDCGPNDRFKP